MTEPIRINVDPSLKLSPSPNGEAMLKLKVGESVTLPYRDDYRPMNEAGCYVSGMQFNLKPSKDGIIVTRVR
jgi:hypothetical protein